MSSSAPSVLASVPHDVRFAVRGLRRRPGFAALVVLTLGLGIGVNVAVLSWIQALLLRPLPLPEADRLVRVTAFKGSEPGRIAQREIEALQRDSRIFDTVASYYLSQYNVTGDGAPEAVPCAITSHHLFEVLGARFALGGPYSGAEDFRRQYRVVLTHDLWQRRYGGDPDIVGRSIVLDGGAYSVDGVLAPGAAFPPGVGLYRQVTEYHGLDGRRHSVLARLRGDATFDGAREELRALGERWQEEHPELNRGVHFEAVPLRESWVGPARPYLTTLALAVGFVLLIAIVNTVQLLLARASDRREELALRVALGAGRWRLMRLSLVESSFLALLGGGVGLAVAALLMRTFDAVVRAELPAWMEIRLDPVVFAVAAVLVLTCAVLTGLVPAALASRSVLGAALRSGLRGTSDRASTRLRDALVVVEIAAALVLLIGAGLMVRSTSALDRQDLGFEPRDLFTVRTDPPWWSYQTVEQTVPFYEQALERLRSLPGIDGVATNQNLPLAGLDETTKRVVTLEGQSASEQEHNPFIHLQSVSSGYFDVMGIPLIRGRSFTSQDRLESSPVAVLSQRLATELWPGREAIGQRFKLGPPESEAPWTSVVGLVGDVRSERRSGEASRDLYVSHLQHFTGDSYFVFRTSLSGDGLVRQIEAAIQAVDPDLPLFDILPMEDRIARVEWQRRATSELFALFGLLALALAAFGTYAVLSTHVAQRGREWGIRQALGARPSDLGFGVLRHGLGLLLHGSFWALAVGLLSVKLVESQLFGVRAADPVSIAAAATTLVLATLLASLVPVLRVARQDPVHALRGADE